MSKHARTCEHGQMFPHGVRAPFRRACRGGLIVGLRTPDDYVPRHVKTSEEILASLGQR